MANPLVSVLIVSYNQEGYIREALLSALDQDYENLQVVIADDASTDKTQQIISDVARHYPAERLKVILGSKNQGVTKNCNEGLRHCHGDFIAFMGGDDVFLPGKITSQVAWFDEHPQMVLCGHEVVLIDQTGQTIDSQFGELGDFATGIGAGGMIRAGVPFSAVSVMVKRSRIPSYGFHKAIPTVSDWKMWIDVVGCDGGYGCVGGKWAKYRRHSGNVTRRRNWGIVRDIALTAVLSLYRMRGRYLKDWWVYFFVRPFAKRLRASRHE